MQQAGVKLALEMPHQRGSKLLDELTDASMSDCVMHEVLQQTGSLDLLQVCPDAADIQDRIAQAAAGRKWRPIVVLAIDAADVPSRPDTAKGTRPGRRKSRARRSRWKGEYHQAKGFRFEGVHPPWLLSIPLVGDRGRQLEFVLNHTQDILCLLHYDGTADLGLSDIVLYSGSLGNW